MNHPPRHAAANAARLLLLAALLLAYAAAPSRALAQTAPPARSAPVGTIKGRVVGDDGQPLAHAVVYLYGRAAGASPRQRAPASTDDEGRFAFDEVEPGLYFAGVYLTGYTPDTEAGEQPASGVYRVGDDVTIRLVKGGVITGTVTDADGGPVVGANIRVSRVRTLDNLPVLAPGLWASAQHVTDDRGVYRVYGLPPGVYLVSAGGGQLWNWMQPSPYDADAPTYFRSATPDTAEEVTLRAGQEVGGVDIRYRGERGHTVSGSLVFPQEAPGDSVNSVNVTLVHAATGMNSAGSVFGGGERRNTFSFEGVADGEYELSASRYAQGGGAATRQRVTVRGADVTGLRVTLMPFGSIGGDLALEPLREPDGPCKTTTRRALFPQEVPVAATRDERAADAAQRRPAPPLRRESVPDASGAFVIRLLEQGRYRIEARPADEGWYVRDIQLPTTTSPSASPSSADTQTTKTPAPRPAPPAATNTATPHALDLKSGQQLTGLKVTVAEGAATLAGRLAPAAADQAAAAPLPPSSRLRVHLVPAPRELAENALRYAETTPAQDGSFAFKHLAPGRYFVFVREAEAELPARRAAWDAAGRARLRREAEAANVSVELQPCQRQTDFALQFPAPRD